MKLSEELYDALNDQIQAEMHSAYVYLSMSAYFESQNLEGFAAWMKGQVKEELTHAMKIYDYLLERDAQPVLKVIEAPPSIWQAPLDAFRGALDHEQYITGRITALIELASAQRDHAAVVFLQWFISEQVEEEASVLKIVQRLEAVGASIGGLFQLDHQAGKSRAS